MRFKQGTHVYSREHHDVGTIDRVVLDPETQEVKALIVRKGWLFTEDKVVPTESVERATEQEVILRGGRDELDSLPEFEDTYYVPADEYELAEGEPVPFAPSLYAYPPVGAAWWGYDPYVGANPAYAYGQDSVARVDENIPEGTVAVREGARVLSVEGDHVGDVEEVFTDEASSRATHILISQGLLFKSRRLIPANWLKITGEDEVILTVPTRVVNDLPDYDA
jgi:uncharacterized protein YrrD